MGGLPNSARDIYWQASALKRYITNSGRKDVERERGSDHFQTGRLGTGAVDNHSVHNNPTLA
jgi:hypothetical protein